MPIAAAMSGVPYTLQNAVDDGDGNPVALPNKFYSHTIQVIGSPGVASGEVQVESASDPFYLGTWNPIGAAVAVAASTELDRNFAGTYPFLRARVSTPLVGGTVTVNYVGSQIQVSSGGGGGPSGYPTLSGNAYDLLRGDGAFSQDYPAGTVASTLPWTFSQTWNAALSTFEALRVGITNTASSAVSKLFSILLDGFHSFSIQAETDTSTSPGQVAIVVNEDVAASKDFSIRAASNIVTINRGDGVVGRPLAARHIFCSPFPFSGVFPIVIGGDQYQGIQAASGRLIGWSASATDALGLDTALARNDVATVEVNDGTAGEFADILARALRSNAVGFAALPATPVEGMMVAVNDANTATWGATITGTGAFHVLAYYNGTNWTVFGK